MFDRILDNAELQQQSSTSSSSSDSNEQKVAAVLRSVAELGEAKRVLLVSQSAAASTATAALQQAITSGVGSSGSVVTVSRSSSSSNCDTNSSATASTDTWDGTAAGLSAALQAAAQSNTAAAAAAAEYDLISLDVKGCCYLPQGRCELYDKLMRNSAAVLCKSGLLAVPLAALTSDEQQAFIAHVEKDRARVEYATLPLAGGVLFIRWKGG
jgi:hypothetical protein